MFVVECSEPSTIEASISASCGVGATPVGPPPLSPDVWCGAGEGAGGGAGGAGGPLLQGSPEPCLLS